MKKTILLCSLLIFNLFGKSQNNFFWSYNATITPVVTTQAVTNIAATSATSGGNITNDGGCAITERGVCWRTSLNPTISNSHTSDGSGTGSFTSSITGLTNGITYYVRAYATNSVGTSYGSNESFETTGITNSGYGKLYNQYAVVSTRNIAKAGWHVPTKAELDALITATGGTTVSGGRLKETGTTHWKTPNTSATNTYGFNAVGSGFVDADQTAGSIQTINEIWASTSTGVVMVMLYNSAQTYTGTLTLLKRGCSVRLIKDDSTLATYIGNDGKTYSTVKIGTQVWMAENLKETYYRDGTPITQVSSYSTWINQTGGAFCWFNFNSSYE